MNFRLICILPLLMLVLFPTVSLADATSPGFADALFDEGDYFRAITEYKRFLYEHPDAAAAPRARLNIARSYLHGERWEKATAALDHVIATSTPSAQADLAQLLLLECAFKQGKYTWVASRSEHPAGHTPQLLDRQQNLRLWALAYQGDYSTALAFAATPNTDLTAADLNRLQQLPTKSPALAGSLSAIIPGSGQLYAKRYKEAGLALLLNAAFIAGGLQAIDSGNEVLGGILFFFEAGWYGGNIYNAMNSVHKYNRTLKNNTLEDLAKRYQFSLLLDDTSALLELSTSLD
jgi:tetratricopeptide (TPR) repeat protein